MSHPGGVDIDMFASIQFPRPADERAERGVGVSLLADLDALTPEWAPGQWGFTEPFQSESRERMRGVWGDGIMWEGAGSRKVLGSYFAGPRDTWGSVDVHSPLGVVDGERAAGLLRAVAADVGGVYGFVHRLVHGDLATSDRRTASIGPGGPRMIVGERQVAQGGLPNLWWANIFGGPVAELLGRERIASTPALAVERIGEQLWYLQLTESILDNEADPEGFEQARLAAKTHLGWDAFYEQGRDRAPRTIRLPEAPPRRRGPSPQAIAGFGPTGFLYRSEVRKWWEPWARGTRQPDVYDLVDLPSDALLELAAVLPDEQLDVEVNQFPTIRSLTDAAREVPDIRFSGQVIGAVAGTESITVHAVSVPAGETSSTLEEAARTADLDEVDSAGRRLIVWT